MKPSIWRKVGGWTPGVAVLGLIVLTAGCTAGNVRYDDSPAGFWAGLWHGMICVITFIVGLFNDNVRMYEVDNVGHLYDLGFLVGAGIIWGGSHGSKAMKCRGK